jgi:hypothetical protein
MLSTRDRKELRTVVTAIEKNDPILARQLRPTWRSSIGRRRANKAETVAVCQAARWSPQLDQAQSQFDFRKAKHQPSDDSEDLLGGALRGRSCPLPSNLDLATAAPLHRRWINPYHAVRIAARHHRASSITQNAGSGPPPVH